MKTFIAIITSLALSLLASSAIIALIVYFHLEIPLRLGNCGSPGLGIAWPCPMEEYLMIFLMGLGTVIGFFALRKYKVRNLAAYTILLFFLQFPIVIQAYRLRYIIATKQSASEVNDALHDQLINTPFAIYAPTQMPNGYHLRQAYPYVPQKEGGTNPDETLISIEYTGANGLITFTEKKLTPSFNPPSRCSNNYIDLSCRLTLETPKGHRLYSTVPESTGGFMKIDNTYIQLTTVPHTTLEDISKMIDSMRIVSQKDFYDNYYLPTSGAPDSL